MTKTTLAVTIVLSFVAAEVAGVGELRRVRDAQAALTIA
jgi:hypothetical protein